MYLEPIFSAQDIQKQLPAEHKAFDQVHRQLREIMRRTKDRPNALQITSNASKCLAAAFRGCLGDKCVYGHSVLKSELSAKRGVHTLLAWYAVGWLAGLLETLTKSLETLEAIQKSLEEYLETKRVAFPRFYFLSNDGLLEILAQAKNAQAIQPHMSKCFDGIRRLDFGDDPKSTEIYAIVSGKPQVTVVWAAASVQACLKCTVQHANSDQSRGLPNANTECFQAPLEALRW